MFNLISFKNGDEVFYKEGKEVYKAKYVSLLENANADKITFGINVEKENGEMDVVLNHSLIEKNEYDAIANKLNNKKTRGRKKMTTVKTETVIDTEVTEKAKTTKAKKEKVAVEKVAKAPKAPKVEVVKPNLKGINTLLDEGRTLIKGETYHDYILLDADGESLGSFKYRKPVKDLFAAIELDNSTEAILAYADAAKPAKKEKVAKTPVVEEVMETEDELLDEADDLEDDDYSDDIEEDIEDENL
jgi:hypothetical protein